MESISAIDGAVAAEVRAGQPELKYLKMDKDGDYSYDTAEVGPIIEVQVRYEMGGSNFLSGSTSARGIYVSVSHAALEKRITEAGKEYTIRVITFAVGGPDSGLKALVASLARKNQRKANTIAYLLDPIVPEIARLAWTDKYAALKLAKERLA